MQDGSPCIAAGTTTNAPSTDLDGNTIAGAGTDVTDGYTPDWAIDALIVCSAGFDCAGTCGGTACLGKWKMYNISSYENGTCSGTPSLSMGNNFDITNEFCYWSGDYDTGYCTCADYNVSGEILGKRINCDITKNIVKLIESKTNQNKIITLNLALNYGSKEEILNACRKIMKSKNVRERIMKSSNIAS